jgi:hypothetical protein
MSLEPNITCSKMQLVDRLFEQLLGSVEIMKSTFHEGAGVPLEMELMLYTIAPNLILFKAISLLCLHNYLFSPTVSFWQYVFFSQLYLKLKCAIFLVKDRETTTPPLGVSDDGLNK